jgi:hypothetical protein
MAAPDGLQGLMDLLQQRQGERQDLRPAGMQFGDWVQGNFNPAAPVSADDVSP